MVHEYVSRLRQALGDASRIATRVPGYLAVCSDDELDARCFSRLTAAARTAARAGKHADALRAYDEALDLWRGDALAGAELEGEARVDAARLDQERLLVKEERVDSALALGLHRDADPRARATRARRTPARTPARSAHARALPRRAADRRARALPRSAGAARRARRNRARPRAARARAGDPAARPGSRARAAAAPSARDAGQGRAAPATVGPADDPRRRRRRRQSRRVAAARLVRTRRWRHRGRRTDRRQLGGGDRRRARAPHRIDRHRPQASSPSAVAAGAGLDLGGERRRGHRLAHRPGDARGDPDHPRRPRPGGYRVRRRLRVGHGWPRRHGLEDRPADEHARPDDRGRERARRHRRRRARRVGRELERSQRHPHRRGDRKRRGASRRSQSGADGVAIGGGSVWVTGEATGIVTRHRCAQRAHPRHDPCRQRSVGRDGRSGLRLGCEQPRRHRDADRPHLRRGRATIPVGDGPNGIARHARRHLGEQRARRHDHEDRSHSRHRRQDRADRQSPRGRRARIRSAVRGRPGIGRRA